MLQLGALLTAVAAAGCFRSVVVGEAAEAPGDAADLGDVDLARPRVDAAPPRDAGPDALQDATADAAPVDAAPDLAPDDAAPDAAPDPCEGALNRRIPVSFERLAPACPWGLGDNLLPAQERATARSEQTFEFASPTAGGELCALRFDFTRGGEAAELRYDDNFFLILNGVVLAASDRDLVARLPREGELVLWQWIRVAGSLMNVTSVDPYCLGEEAGIGSCLVPDTDSLGAFRLDLPLERFPELIARAEGADVTLRFVTVGDNDPDTDCSHGGVSFELSYAFVP